MVTAEIVTIGDEILFGQIIDTNSSWIGAALSDIGIKVLRRASVGDEKSEILDILTQASGRVDIVIITGGLGPTKDDITKHCFCDFFGTELIENSQALAHLKAFFEKRGRELSAINRLQASLPANCTYIPNNYGTAPGMWFQKGQTIMVSLPGVPGEMKGIMSDEIIPRLKAHFNPPVIHHKIIKTIGAGESVLAEIIKDWEENLPSHIKLAYLPSLGEVKLRLTCHGSHKETLEKEADAQAAMLAALIPEYVYGYENDELQSVVAQLLTDKNLKIATAESCTGGYLSHMITSLAGSSAYFEGGVISYSYDLKEHLLGVDHNTLLDHGAVSEATIKQMAQGARERLGVDIALATSGIAGPGGGMPGKPVGTVWIALSSKEHIITKKLQLGGSRAQNIQLSATILLNLLRKYLLGLPMENTW